MKFNLYYSALNSISANQLLADLKNRDKNKKHIIITPDKSSLYYERKLFDLLNEDCFFDVSTTTLSRFANSVIGKSNNILSKQGGVLIVKRILIENKSKLVSFAKASDLIGFAGSLFDTICMFKSCHIGPEEIEEVKNLTLNNKLKDIKLVYEKYEEYLKQEYTDSFNRLNLCASKISKSQYRDTNFYFVGFDDFTKQGYCIIDKLINCANEVSVATTFAKKTDTKKNYNIYLNNVYYNCIELAKLNGVECNKIEVINVLENEKKFLSEQLYANKMISYTGKQNYVKLLKYETLEDEIKNTAINLKYNVINSGLRYKNFAIVVSDLNKYKSKLKKYLEDLNVDYFIDEGVKLRETFLARFISNLISILYKPTKNNIVLYLKNVLFDINYKDIDKYISFVDKYEPQFGKLLKYENCENISKYLNFLDKYYNNGIESSISDLLKNVRSLLDDLNFEDCLNKLLMKYYNNNELESYRELKQSYVKIMKIFDEIKVLNDYECNYLEFNKFFDLFTDNISIVVPPIMSDAVIVTDINCENLNNIDYVYFLGFNEGCAPVYNTDTGIISDDEISIMPQKSRLNPTINVINKRLKFKLFELMFVANKKIIVSFPAKLNESDMFPNVIISNLQAIYGIDKIDNASLDLDLINNNILNFNKDNFIYNNISQKIAADNYVRLLKYWDNYQSNKSYVKTLSILNDVVGDTTYFDNMNFKNIINPICKGLFLKNKKIGISEVEKFNSCPYVHYVEYGLKLKPCEKNDISAIDLGNIIHEFVKEIIFKLDKENLVRDVLDKILNKDEYKYLLENTANNFTIKALYDEAVRIRNVLKYQQSISSFKTISVEMPFNYKVCCLDDNEILLTGVIDRVDEFNEGLRIIDYKTGSVKFKDYEDIYYGNKIQVVVYLSILSKSKNLTPLGALYFPISNAFADNNCEEIYQMQGVIRNDLENIMAFDKNLSNISYTSDIINLSTTSKGQIASNAFYKKMCINDEQFEKLSKFVVDLVIETIKKINNHEIQPFPIDEDVCKFCEYRGMCNFSEKYGNKYRKCDSVKTLEELLGGEYGRD